MFQIEKQFFGEAREIILKSSSGVSLTCVPDFGANIRELFLLKNNHPIQVLDGFKTFEQLQQNEKSRGIFLIPFPNRIKDGKYSFEGKEYPLTITKPKEQNAIHGFLWNRKFELTESVLQENSATIELQHHYHGDYAGFLFPFLTDLILNLTASELKITVAITNTGKTNMPLGIGWHPYFSFQKNVNDLLLQIPASDILETDERMIPTGNRKIYNEFQELQKIENNLFDTCFKFLQAEKTYETKIFDAVTNTTIILWQEITFPYLQIYIPPERNSIAVEPMTCPANAFNSKENLLTLKPNEKFEGSFGVRVE
jgi:aldose 1-epimerase